MAQDEIEAALLLTDITGSTTLYEQIGDAAALRHISDSLERSRAIVAEAGGDSLRSKGDDLLCVFAEPVQALRAARRMLQQHTSGPLAIHAGLHFGHLIRTHDDVFGDAVNLTSRLASLAKPGEVLLSQSFVDHLPAGEARSLRFLDQITLKGKREPTNVYSFLPDDAAPQTEIASLLSPRPAAPATTAAPGVTVSLRYAGRTHSCAEGASLTIGRAADCGLVVNRPWVSRQHATVTVRSSRVELNDQSASGTYVTSGERGSFIVRRETVWLAGTGVISPARPPGDAAELIHYEVADPEPGNGT